MELFGLLLLFVFFLWGVYKMPGYRAPAVPGEKKSDNIGGYPVQGRQSTGYPFYLESSSIGFDSSSIGFDYFDPAVRNLMGDD